MFGEIGMDLIDAITEWSDRVDEELTDDDVNAILRIQLAIDDGAYRDLDIGEYSAADLAKLKSELHEVEAPDFTAWVIDETLAEFDVVPAAEPTSLNDDEQTDETHETDEEADEETDETHDEAEVDTGDADLETDEDVPGNDEDIPEDDLSDDGPVVVLEGIFATAAQEELTDDDRSSLGAFGWATSGTDSVLGSTPVDTETSHNFFVELEGSTTASVTRAPVELKDGPDALGPAFLPPAQQSYKMHLGLAVVAIVALVAFVLAGIQLMQNAERGDSDETVSTDDTGTTNAERNTDPTPDDTERSDNPNSSTDTSDESDDVLVQATPTPSPELPPAESRAIVLTTAGEVWAIDLHPRSSAEPTVLFAEDAAAIDMSIVEVGLAIVDEDGAVHVLNLDEPRERVKVWRKGSLAEAQQIVDTGKQYAVLDSAGSISLFDRTRAATSSNVTVVWDAGVGGTPPARSIDAYRDLVPFTIGNGEVRMIVTSIDGNPVNTIWDPTDQPRAFNMAINEHGLLMGVGAGAVARYQWFEDGPPFQAVWDPLDGSRLPAIGYTGLDGRAAVVLNSGTVASVADDGTEAVLWDAEISDQPATSVASSAKEVLLVLDNGSVLRIATNGSTEARGTVWDATDDSTSPAAQVLVVDL